MSGAVDFNECWRYRNRCNCVPICLLCGHRKHVSLHGPFYKQPPGSQPYGHEYQPKEPKLKKGALMHDFIRYEVLETITMLPNESFDEFIRRGIREELIVPVHANLARLHPSE